MITNSNEDKVDLNSEQLNNLSAATSNPARDFWEFLLDLLKTGVVVFLIAFGLRYFVIQPYIVDGESMMPNYQNNEYLLAEKLSYEFGEPARGDVVIFKYPKNTKVNYIKRIIGLPGEKVKIENNLITIYNSNHVDGQVLGEDYLAQGVLTETTNGNPLEITLKSNEYFVMGDNREHSSDSREWGILPKANILGRSWLTLTPFKLAGFHKRISYPNLSILMTKPLAMLDLGRTQ